MVSARTLSSADLLGRFARDGRVFLWRLPLLTSAGAYRKRNDCKQEARLFEIVHNNGVAPSHGRVGWNCRVSPKTFAPATSRPLTGAWVGTGSPDSGTSLMDPSRPLTGAWVGTKPIGSTVRRSTMSRPLTGAWVGTPAAGAMVCPSYVAPSHGRVGWNCQILNRFTNPVGRALSRARGLEHRGDAAHRGRA